MKRTTLAIAIAALSLIAANCSLPAQNPTSGSQLFGAWSNVKVTEGEDPHAYGIEVELWKHNGELFGFLAEFVGPVADPPVGKLESMEFDDKTGKLSFVAKLSLGVVRSSDGKAWIPAKNRYEFKGSVDKSPLTGSLRRTLIHDDGTETTSQENLTLNGRQASDGAPATSESYEEWTERWNRVLKVRGPK